MVAPAIYVQDSPDDFNSMRELPWESEDAIQEVVALAPGLLAGEASPDSDHRFLLIRREHGIPDAVGGSDRWSVDHLFVDRDGVPTLVEVKRSTDTRIRREVVGQMLDYAANAVLHWGEERIRGEFEASQAPGAADDLLVERGFAVTRDDVDTFWARVNENMASGRMRLVFVADEIPRELRSIVELLNEQMKTTEVLALEVRRYAGGDRTVVTATVIGDTAKAQTVKGSPPEGSTWEPDEVLAAAAKVAPAVSISAVRWLTDFTATHGRLESPRTKNPSVSGVLDLDVGPVKVWHLTVWDGTSPSLQIAFEALVKAGVNPAGIDQFAQALAPALGDKLESVRAKEFAAWPFLSLKRELNRPDALGVVTLAFEGLVG